MHHHPRDQDRNLKSVMHLLWGKLGNFYIYTIIHTSLYNEKNVDKVVKENLWEPSLEDLLHKFSVQVNARICVYS